MRSTSLSDLLYINNEKWARPEKRGYECIYSRKHSLAWEKYKSVWGKFEICYGFG